jgi:hypothetical protein
MRQTRERETEHKGHRNKNTKTSRRKDHKRKGTAAEWVLGAQEQQQQQQRAKEGGPTASCPTNALALHLQLAGAHSSAL